MNFPMPVINDISRRIIGESAPMQAALRQVAQVAPTKATVLITGETGIGKDVIAQAILESSPRENRPFKAVNCSAFYQAFFKANSSVMRRDLLQGQPVNGGVFEQADGGTLCEHIEELPRATQGPVAHVESFSDKTHNRAMTLFLMLPSEELVLLVL